MPRNETPPGRMGWLRILILAALLILLLVVGAAIASGGLR